MDMHCAPCLGYDPHVAPLFNDFPYAQWMFRFKLFARSKHIDIWEIIECAYVVPNLDKSKWSTNDKRLSIMNKILLEFLLNALDHSISNKLAHFDSAYKLWKFIEAHQGDLEKIRRALAESTSSEVGASSSSSSCTRPLGDSPSVVCESDSDSDLSFDELACASEKLLHAYNKLHKNFIDLKSKHDNLKSDHEKLASKFDIIAQENVTLKENNDMLNLENNQLKIDIANLTHEKNDAILEVEAIKNKLDTFVNDYASSTSNNNACMYNGELNHVKDRISSLDSTLKTCIANNDKLMDLCAKSRVNASKKPTHYAHMYNKIYKCSICGRKGHIAKFCYNAQKSKKPNHFCASHQASSQHTHMHASNVHHKLNHVYKCDICGRFGHLAKFCFDLKKVSHLPNVVRRPQKFRCDVCGRFGHLAQFCFDLQKVSKLQNVPKRPFLFDDVSHLQKAFKRPSMFANDSRAQAKGQYIQMRLFHCTHCNRKGHLSDYCYDRIRAPYTSKRVHNPRALSLNDRGHVPKLFGTKSNWVPKHV